MPLQIRFQFFMSKFAKMARGGSGGRLLSFFLLDQLVHGINDEERAHMPITTQLFPEFTIPLVIYA